MINLIVPIHNELPYLKRCFDSIACQVGKDIRVILVDDHSTDGSYDYARQRAGFEGWTLLQTKLGEYGVSCARNKGLEEIDSINSYDEWVTFLDSDDELTPNAFDVMRKAIKKNPDATWFQFNHLRYYSALGKTVKKYANRNGEFNLNNFREAKCWWGAWNKLIKLRAMDYNFEERLTFGEDGVFVLEHLLNGARIMTINKETVIHHFENPHSLTKTKTKEQLEALEQVHRKLLEYYAISERPWQPIKAIVDIIEENRNNPIYKAILGGEA